jgi:hypothetical protein
VLDKGNFIYPRLSRQPDIEPWSLWATVTNPTSLAPDPQITDSWYSTSTIPPDPWMDAAINPSLTSSASDTRQLEAPDDPDATMAYSSASDESVAVLNSQQVPPTPSAGYMLVPRFLRFPFAVTLPVGLVMDPKHMSGSTFRDLIAHLSGDSDRRLSSWLDNVILDAWFASVSAAPDLFQVEAYPHTIFETLFPDDAQPERLSIRLHQEWALLSQIIWDHAFTIPSTDSSSQSSLSLLKYAEALLSAHNCEHVSDALATTTWGFVASVFRHPFLPFLRPLPDDCPMIQGTRLPALFHIQDEHLPIYMQPWSPYLLTVPGRKEHFSCPPITARDPKDTSLLPDSQTFDPDSSDDDGSRTQSTNTSKTNTMKNPFHQSGGGPPAKKVRRSMDPSSFSTSAVTTTRTPVFADPTPVMPSNTVVGMPGSKDAPWNLPIFLRTQSSLPMADNPQKMSQALAVAIRQCAAESPLPSSTGSSNSDPPVTAIFSRDLMLSSATCREPVARIAFWLSFRCALEGDPALNTIGPPSLPYIDDYHFAPGRLSPELATLFKACYQKNASTTTVKSLQTWFQRQVAQASTTKSSRCPDLECRIRQSFFTIDLVQAILNMDFTSGYTIQSDDEPSSLITPWHFIRSLQDFESHQGSRIPADGLSATQLSDIIGNILFLFSLLACDFRDFTKLGYGHSSFSRFSPLAGHLLLLDSYLKDRKLVDCWDRLENLKRFELTKAVFIAIADLFQLYETWIDPKNEPKDTFLIARVQNCSTQLTLLNPGINIDRDRMLTYLEPWRQQLKVFTASRLRTELPRDGFFDTDTPACFLPLASSDPATLPRGTASVISEISASTGMSHATLGNRDSSRTNRQQPSQRRGTTTASGESQQQRPNTTVSRARVAAITAAPAQNGVIKPINEVLSVINRDRTDQNKIRAPTCKVGNARRARPLCFRFACSQGPGCTFGNRCHYVHLDLGDPQWINDNIPPTFIPTLIAFLESPELSPYYSPTDALRTFLGQR